MVPQPLLAALRAITAPAERKALLARVKASLTEPTRHRGQRAAPRSSA